MDFDVVDELKKRCTILIENTKPYDVTTGMDGNFMTFVMTLCPAGYPHPPLPWMDADYTKAIMSDEIFHSRLYDDMFLFLFREAYEKVNDTEPDLKRILK
jgi:hypothetical protein